MYAFKGKKYHGFEIWGCFIVVSCIISKQYMFKIYKFTNTKLITTNLNFPSFPLFANIFL